MIFYSYQPSSCGKPADLRVRDLGFFRQNTMWFSTPDAFNDPFDVRPMINADRNYRPTMKEMMRMSVNQMPGAPRNERRREAQRRLKLYDDASFRVERSEQLRAMLAEDFRRCSIACFTTHPADIRMWSYYGSKHQGYCVGLSFDNIWTYTAPDLSRVRLVPQQVKYSSAYPVVDADANWDDEKEVQKLALASVLTKADIWKSEDEWRCYRPGTPAGAQVFPPQALRQVIFGACIDGAYRTHLIQMLRERALPIEMFDALCASGRYEIVLRPIQRDW